MRPHLEFLQQLQHNSGRCPLGRTKGGSELSCCVTHRHWTNVVPPWWFFFSAPSAQSESITVLWTLPGVPECLCSPEPTEHLTRHWLGTFTSLCHLWYRQRPFAHIEEDTRRVALKRQTRVLKSVFLSDKGSRRILVVIAKESQPHASD